jgi:hypothetical protein
MNERSEAISAGLRSAPAAPEQQKRLRELVAKHGEHYVRTRLVPASRVAFARLCAGLPVAPETLVVLAAALQVAR